MKNLLTRNDNTLQEKRLIYCIKKQANTLRKVKVTGSEVVIDKKVNFKVMF